MGVVRAPGPPTISGPPTRHGRGCLTDLVKMDRVGQPTGHRTLLVTLSELVPSRDRPPPPTGHAHTPAD
ncbi:hypothetical protein N7493_009352 [Penicillium malachiteum]|uniref:Uncharacterized protein n=1 Tax=Penicillium malachiteum TaxID=1324776 RepID=A0AAD6MSM1_9EURO|nr:hypothetical protein N7493_009352 [Penicillium malachiteum]